MSVPRIIVRDLSTYGDKDELRKVYSRYGRITNVWIANNPPGFAYVFFGTMNEAMKAVTGTNGKFVCGRRVRVELSPIEEKRPNFTSPAQRGRGASPRQHNRRNIHSSPESYTPREIHMHSPPTFGSHGNDRYNHQSSLPTRGRNPILRRGSHGKGHGNQSFNMEGASHHRDSRGHRNTRDNFDFMVNQDVMKDSRNHRDSRDFKEAHSFRDNRDVRETHNFSRGSRDQRGDEDFRGGRDYHDTRHNTDYDSKRSVVSRGKTGRSHFQHNSPPGFHSSSPSPPPRQINYDMKPMRYIQSQSPPPQRFKSRQYSKGDSPSRGGARQQSYTSSSPPRYKHQSSQHEPGRQPQSFLRGSSPTGHRGGHAKSSSMDPRRKRSASDRSSQQHGSQDQYTSHRSPSHNRHPQSSAAFNSSWEGRDSKRERQDHRSARRGRERSSSYRSGGGSSTRRNRSRSPHHTRKGERKYQRRNSPMSATFFTYEDDDDDDNAEKDEKQEKDVSISSSPRPYLKENGTPTRDEPPRDEIEQPVYHDDHYLRRSPEGGMSPSYIDNGGNPVEFVTEDAQYLPSVNPPEYNPEPDQQVFTGGEYPSNQPMEDAQFLQIDEVRENVPSVDYLDEQEDHRKAFYPERQVIYSPSPPPEREIVRIIKRERKVVVSRSPHGERFVISLDDL